MPLVRDLVPGGATPMPPSKTLTSRGSARCPGDACPDSDLPPADSLADSADTLADSGEFPAEGAWLWLDPSGHVRDLATLRSALNTRRAFGIPGASLLSFFLPQALREQAGLDDGGAFERELAQALGGQAVTTRVTCATGDFQVALAPTQCVLGHPAGAICAVSPLESTPSTRVRALVVEPDPEARALLTSYLRSAQVPCGTDVREAGSALEAFQRLGTFAPDLIVLQVYLPTLDGLSFLRALRADPRYREVSVVAVLAHPPTDAELERLKDYVSVIVQPKVGRSRPAVEVQLQPVFEALAARAKDVCREKGLRGS